MNSFIGTHWQARGVAVMTALLACCASAGDCDLNLQYIGQHSIPFGTRIGVEEVGGISGIDYDPRHKVWYLISDDRTRAPLARLFTARLAVDAGQVSVDLGRAYRLHAQGAVDAEAIRIDPLDGSLLIAGEGDQSQRLAPWLYRTNVRGELIERLRLPAMFMPAAASGARSNKSIEGLSLAGRSLWLALEAPLLQDGPMASPRSAADVRLTRLATDGTLSAQFVYRTDTASPHGKDESSDLGVSEILALSDRALLVLERSGVKSANTFRFRTRLYCADVSGATDVGSFPSLRGQDYRVAGKRLLMDFDTLPIAAGNLEAMGWGDALPDGARSLVFANDNNFFPGEPTRLLVFGVR